MNKALHPLTTRYQGTLRAYLKKGSPVDYKTAHALGTQFLELGLKPLELAKIHQSILPDLRSSRRSPEGNDKMEERAELFFDQVIAPVRRATLHRDPKNTELRKRTAELANTNRNLQREIRQRKATDAALKKSEEHYRLLLDKSRKQQEQLRYLSHQIIIENEEQRKQISRELHDEIAQILVGINVHLSALKVESAFNTKGLAKKISTTQRLIQKSMKIVRRFATQLRPTVLDDLGIIPALKTYVNDFTKRTGIQVLFSAFPEVEELNSTKRTVLYRVAQAALANITQHAEATRVKVTIKKHHRVVCMEIHDNGKSFDVQQALQSKMNEHLGLIGMRERVEMVGGSFGVESKVGSGTTIFAEIPSINSRSATSPIPDRKKLLLI
jgi:signal transduction histidine kinase